MSENQKKPQIPSELIVDSQYKHILKDAALNVQVGLVGSSLASLVLFRRNATRVKFAVVATSAYVLYNLAQDSKTFSSYKKNSY